MLQRETSWARGAAWPLLASLLLAGGCAVPEVVGDEPSPPDADSTAAETVADTGDVSAGRDGDAREDAVGDALGDTLDAADALGDPGEVGETGGDTLGEAGETVGDAPEPETGAEVGELPDEDGDAAETVDGDVGPGPCPTCPGAAQPTWVLDDFQPDSQHFGTTHGLASYGGQPILVALLAASDGTDKDRALGLQLVLTALVDVPVVFVGVNAADALAEQADLADLCTFPLFQDTFGVQAFDAHGGAAGDLFIYGADETLAKYLPAGGDYDPSTMAGRLKLEGLLTGLFTP